MGKHGDGKGGEEGDQVQSPRESDGQWKKPVPPPEPEDPPSERT
ncbi:hypothetical protein [Streptomyces albipurpureus]|nr:hypothetical protein [Streptomyces sp. CWNU-1]